MASTPLVSIGFPVYNGEATLRRAIDSILQQDFKDFELVIADNASSDGTAAICEDYASRDARVRYFRNPANIGPSPNHNLVFEKSRGQYFAWAAHDIEQLPGMLSRCVKEMQSGPVQPVLVYPLCELLGDTGMPADFEPPSIASNDPRAYRRLNTVIHNIVFVTQHYGLFDAAALRKTRLNGSYASSDYVLTAELAMLGEIREIKELLLRRTIEKHRGTAAVIGDKKKWALWNDPNKKQRLTFLPLRERLAFEYFRSAWKLPLRPKDKLACLVVGPLAPYWKILLRVTGPVRHKLRARKPVNRRTEGRGDQNP